MADGGGLKLDEESDGKSVGREKKSSKKSQKIAKIVVFLDGNPQIGRER